MIYLNENDVVLGRRLLSCMSVHLLVVLLILFFVIVFFESSQLLMAILKLVSFVPIFDNIRQKSDNPEIFQWLALIALADVIFYSLHMGWITKRKRFTRINYKFLSENIKATFSTVIILLAFFYFGFYEWLFYLSPSNQSNFLSNIVMFFITKIFLVYIFILLIFSSKSK